MLKNNAPVPGIEVQASTFLNDDPGTLGPGVNYTANTDAQGHFSFTHVFGGEYWIKVAPNFEQNGLTTSRLKIRPAQPATITLTLPN